MAKNHDHITVPACTHQNLKYCSTCSRPYCADCGQEWTSVPSGPIPRPSWPKWPPPPIGPTWYYNQGTETIPVHDHRV